MNNYGDNRFRRWWKRLTPGRESCAVGGYELCREIEGDITTIAIEGCDEAKEGRLLRCLLDFLTRQPSQEYFAYIWPHGATPEFEVDSLREWGLPKNRRLYATDAAAIRKASADWFDARCTTLGACGSVAALHSYIVRHDFTPDFALRRGCVSAYVCGDETGGFSVGYKGTLQEDLFQELKDMLR